MPARKRKQNGLKVSNFSVLLVIIKWQAREGVKFLWTVYVSFWIVSVHWLHWQTHYVCAVGPGFPLSAVLWASRVKQRSGVKLPIFFGIRFFRDTQLVSTDQSLTIVSVMNQCITEHVTSHNWVKSNCFNSLYWFPYKQPQTSPVPWWTTPHSEPRFPAPSSKLSVPELVTRPPKGHSLSPRSCPPKLSAPSGKFGY